METIIVIGIMILLLIGFICLPRLTLIIVLYMSGAITFITCISIGIIGFVYDAMMLFIYGKVIEQNEKEFSI